MNGLSSYFRQGNGAAGLPGANFGDGGFGFGSFNSVGDGLNKNCATENLDRKLAGIMYADIADYTRLTEQDEEGAHQLVMKAIEVMMSHISANRGRIAHLAGDAILAEFRDAESALHCAINVQLAARQWNADLHFDRHVLFRIGLNFGNVISERGDIYGNAVNLAARLEQLASSGGICVSESVRERLEGHPSFKFVTMGERYVKNISEPIQVSCIEFDDEQVMASDLL